MLKEWFRTIFGRNAGQNGYIGKLEPYLADSSSCAILRLVLENPGITPASLAERARVDEGTATAVLGKLAAAGLVVAGSEYGPPGYHIAAAAKAAVVERLPLHYQCPGLKRE